MAFFVRVGQCLGHVLMFVYCCLPYTHLTYADNDICSIEASLNQDLSNINRRLIANKLTINMTKTEFMLIGSRQKLNSLSAIPALEINGTQ